MGQYTDVSSVQAEFKSLTLSGSTAVSSTDVAEFIVQEEFALDGDLVTVYEIPITGSKSISIMKRMATLMTKARILDILAVKTGKSEADQGNEASLLREQVNAMIQKLVTKKMLLPDATLAESGEGVRDYNSNNDITQTFEAGVDQW